MSRKIVGVTVGTPLGISAIKEKLNPVTSVNGVEADENGNVEITIPASGGKSDYVVQPTAPEDTSVLWVDPTDNTDDGFQEAVNAALAQAKESGEFDGDDYVLTPADKTEIAEMAAEKVEVPEGGGITVTGAKVGQTVTIAEVDETGKPTAWEPTDFPSDEHINGLINTALGVIENGTY